ncbi:MAG: hypothetical protein KIT57_23370 [Blastocatellales bacterium]|nr:hypothetical protein [Blastocatellales bacterium]
MKIKQITYLFLMIVCVSLESLAQEKDVSPKRFEYLERRTISFVVGNQEFEIDFTDDDLARTPFWDIEKKPAPIPTERAIDIGRKSLEKYVQTPAEWRVEKVHYDKVGNDKWVCIVAFRSPTSEVGDSDEFTIVIKMDEKVIEPKVSLLQKAIK